MLLLLVVAAVIGFFLLRWAAESPDRQSTATAAQLLVAASPSPFAPIATSPPAANTATVPAQPLAVTEQPLIILPLAGPVSQSKAEISGMAWYGETLILLPQYPGRFGNVVFGIPKSAILAFLSGDSSAPLEPVEIPLIADGLEAQVADFEGFEALTFAGDQAYLAIEASPGKMMGYVVAGSMAPDLSELRLDPAMLVENLPQVQIENFTDEALLVYDGALFTFFENYGAAFNPAPSAHCFALDLQPCAAASLPFPAIEYRITDVTPPDELGRFWAINYFFTGDTKIQPQVDPLAEQYGEGPTHALYTTVERLVQFQISATGAGLPHISLTDTPPIQLQLIDDDNARNWEAIARLDGQGFLLATDKYPETILAFILSP